MSVQLDGEIESLKTELQSCVANTLDREKKDEIIAECVAFAKAILTSGENNDEFIKQILESMTVSKDNIITVKLNLLPFKWKFALSSVVTAAGSSFYPKAEQHIKNVSENVQRDHSTTDVPTLEVKWSLLRFKFHSIGRGKSRTYKTTSIDADTSTDKRWFSVFVTLI